jgi:phosphonate transport system ATP-binding protein
MPGAVLAAERSAGLGGGMAFDGAIEVRAAAKTFGSLRALDGVSLRVARGEMVGLIGPSGAGKSTLLRAINGLSVLDGDDGAIEACGAVVQRAGRLADDVRRTRARIGMVAQSFNLVGRLSLFTNAALGLLGRISFWRGLAGRWSKAERAAVMAALARVGVAEQAGQRASTLSGGQQQRGAIARALVQEAEIILADEPVASLDPAAARRVMDLLAELNRERGITVVVSLHQVDYALRYCPRVVAMKAGRIVFDGPSASLDPARLAEIYGPEIEDAYLVDGSR